jgi:TPR repeat protein
MTEAALQDLRIQAKAGDVRAQVGLGNALLSTHPFGTPTFDEGLGWLERAAKGGDAEAQWYLGCLHLQVTRLPDPFNTAARWFERAAAQEFAPAFDRLADLHLTGLGAPQDDAAAAALIERAARQGYPTATATLAYLHTQGLRRVCTRRRSQPDTRPRTSRSGCALPRAPASRSTARSPMRCSAAPPTPNTPGRASRPRP